MTFKPRVDADAVQRELKSLLEGIPPVAPAGSGGSLRGGFSILDDGDCLYTNIPYRGRILSGIVLSGEPLEGKDTNGNYVCRTQDGWMQWIASPQNVKGYDLADGEVIFQCLCREYLLRNDPTCGALFQKRVPYWQALFKRYSLTTSIRLDYQRNIEAIVTRRAAYPGPSGTSSLLIPEFPVHANNNWSYVLLAKEQPESSFGVVEHLPSHVVPVVKEFLGEGFAIAGAVFQYFSRRTSGMLREVRLGVPTSQNRDRKIVLTLGGLSSYNYFGIGPDGIVCDNWPALGVRVAPNTP